MKIRTRQRFATLPLFIGMPLAPCLLPYWSDLQFANQRTHEAKHTCNFWQGRDVLVCIYIIYVHSWNSHCEIFVSWIRHTARRGTYRAMLSTCLSVCLCLEMRQCCDMSIWSGWVGDVGDFLKDRQSRRLFLKFQNLLGPICKRPWKVRVYISVRFIQGRQAQHFEAGLPLM